MFGRQAWGAVMDLHKTVLSILQADACHALTFNDVVSGVAELLKDDIRTTLNELTNITEIRRHVGGRGHSWRHQANRVKRRRVENVYFSGRLKCVSSLSSFSAWHCLLRCRWPVRSILVTPPSFLLARADLGRSLHCGRCLVLPTFIHSPLLATLTIHLPSRQGI